MSTEPKRQERGRRRIELILDVAEQVFGEVGYDAATTNLIAARADISPGSLYQYFANKEAIAEALTDRYVEVLAVTHDLVLDPALASVPVAEMVDRVVDPLIAFNVAHPAAKSLLHGADVSPTLATSTRALHETLEGRLDTLIEARLPDVPATKRALVATVSMQIFKGLLPTVLDAKPKDRPAVIQELKGALVGYWTSLEKQGGGNR